MSWTNDKSKWYHMAVRVDPSIRLHTKDHWWWKLFGKTNRTQTVSMYGPHLFIPREWNDIEHAIWHEGRHVEQCRWFGLWTHPWVGFLPFSIVNVFLLPVFFTVRFWLELDAETHALKRKVATGSKLGWARHELVEFAKLLCTGAYVWSWIKPWAVRIAKRKRLLP
jgi:hypothetical protein